MSSSVCSLRKEPSLRAEKRIIFFGISLGGGGRGRGGDLSPRGIVSLILSVRPDYRRRRPPLVHPSSAGISSLRGELSSLEGSSHLTFVAVRRSRRSQGKGRRCATKGPACSIFPSVWCYASPRIKGVSTAETGIDLSVLLSLSQAAAQARRG